jgi:hypothetical protein
VPEALSSARQGAPAPAQPSPASPAGHQADAARRLIRRLPPSAPRHRSTSSCTAVPGVAGRPSDRRGAPLHPALPPGAARPQAAHAREHPLLHSRLRRRQPAIRPTQRAIASGSSGAAAQCPEAPSSAPAPALSSPTAPAGHQADVAHRLILRGRPVPQGIKQRTSSCAVVPDGARQASGRRGAPSRPAKRSIV